MSASLIAAGADLLTGWMNNSAAASRQEDAQQFSAEQFATRYQTTVKDMQAAGLNPMLAYGQGGGNAPTSSAASSAGTPSLGTSLTQGAQLDLMKAQARKTSAEANVTEQFGAKQAQADLDKTLVDTGLSSSQIAKVNAETTNIVQTLNNIKSEDARLVKAARMLEQQAQLMSAQNTTEAQRQVVLQNQARLIIAQTGLANLDINAAQAFNNLGREAGQLKPVVDMLKSLLRK